MTLRSVSLCILAIAASSTAFADDASHLEKAREYIRVTKAEAAFNQSLNSSFGDLSKLPGLESLPPQAKAVVNDFQSKILQLIKENASWDWMKGNMEKIVVETFTEKELDDLIAFYKTPTGESVAGKMGEVATRSMALTQQFLMTLTPKIQALSQEMSKAMMEAMAPSPAGPKPLPAPAK